MIQFKSDQGEISVSSAVFSNITGMAATNCFGVKGMAYRSMTDGLVHLLRREAMSKGVSITYHDDNSISIELHIIVENGVNIPAVCRSIMSEVRYVVTKNTGVPVQAVDVCVDSMTLCGGAKSEERTDYRRAVQADGASRRRCHHRAETGHQRPERVSRARR